MSRVISLLGFFVAFFVASESTKSILGTMNGGDTDREVSGDVGVPSSTQYSVHASNAQLQRQLQRRQNSVQMQLNQSSQRRRSTPKSGYVTSAPKQSKKRRAKQGDVTSNPYAE